MIIVRPYKTKFRSSLILHHMNLKKRERDTNSTWQMSYTKVYHPHPAKIWNSLANHCMPMNYHTLTNRTKETNIKCWAEKTDLPICTNYSLPKSSKLKPSDIVSNLLLSPRKPSPQVMDPLYNVANIYIVNNRERGKEKVSLHQGKEESGVGGNDLGQRGQLTLVFSFTRIQEVFSVCC